MSIKLLTEHHLELLSLKGDCIGSSESTLVKIPHCWKTRVMAQVSLQQTERNIIILYRKHMALGVRKPVFDVCNN